MPNPLRCRQMEFPGEQETIEVKCTYSTQYNDQLIAFYSQSVERLEDMTAKNIENPSLPRTQAEQDALKMVFNLRIALASCLRRKEFDLESVEK